MRERAFQRGNSVRQPKFRRVKFIHLSSLEWERRPKEDGLWSRHGVPENAVAKTWPSFVDIGK